VATFATKNKFLLIEAGSHLFYDTYEKKKRKEGIYYDNERTCVADAVTLYPA
jgi:hypothetical protein